MSKLNPITLVRAFKYMSLDVPDVAPDKSPEEVRDLLTAAYPDIATASVEGPVVEAGKLVYTFVRAVRDKG